MLTPTNNPVWPSVRRGALAALAAASSVIFTVLLLSLRHVEGVPGFVVALLVAFIFFSAWRPGAALMVVAGAVPVATWTGRWWNGGVSWPEALVVSFVAGYFARGMWSRNERRDNLGPPIFVLAAFVIASLAVRVLVLHWTIGGEALWLQLRQLATADYFVGSGGFRELDAAMRLIEGMVLLRAASAQSGSTFVPRLARWFVGGAAAAGALNLWRLWQGALNVDAPIQALWAYLTTLRYNVHYADVNAAGSYFVMALLAAIGVAIATKHARWIPAVVLIGLSLMLSGSRAALAAGGLAALGWAVLALGLGRARMSTRRALIGWGLIVLVISPVALYFVSARASAAPVSTALEIRAEFARITGRMIADRPAFGVGVGRYAERTNAYLPPVTKVDFRLSSENAHNNFLQVLGELGILGFAGFLWVLGSAGLRGMRLLSAVHDPLLQGVGAGVTAFVLTWLAGHPLLIDEPAFLFWVLLGTVAGWSLTSPNVSRQASRARGLAGALIVLVALSVPLRARHELRDVSLEHAGIGLSMWQHGADGVRYRVAGTHSTVFVPSGARVVTVPLRSAQPDTELEVALRLDNRNADVVRVPPDRWFELRMALPADADAPRFYRLDFRVVRSPAERDVLMIGKVEPR